MSKCAMDGAADVINYYTYLNSSVNAPVHLVVYGERTSGLSYTVAPVVAVAENTGVRFFCRVERLDDRTPAIAQREPAMRTSSDRDVGDDIRQLGVCTGLSYGSCCCRYGRLIVFVVCKQYTFVTPQSIMCQQCTTKCLQSSRTRDFVRNIENGLPYLAVTKTIVLTDL